MDDLSAVDIRILGSLVEKQRITPDAYPLTLNALRVACNQTTSRDPITSYDDAALRDGLERLGRNGLARLTSGPGSRAPKYRHLLEEGWALSAADLAALAVVWLRGPQTTAEVRARSERLHLFASLDAVEATLTSLAERHRVVLGERRRWRATTGAADDAAPAPVPPSRDSLEQRVAALEAQVAAIRDRLDAIG